MKQIKRLVIALYILLLVCMGLITIVEKYEGTAFVSEKMYGSWWFTALWALLTAASVVYFVRRRVRRLSLVLLHLSFVIILIGALLTHLTATKGVVQLRQGETTDRYLILEGNETKERSLPFSITLNSFEVKYHDGTAAPSDYISEISLSEQGSNNNETARSSIKGTVSMNKIFTYKGMRFYQSSYTSDMRGSVISVNSDPFGIPVTYVGYALLFVSLVWMLIDPKGKYREIVRKMSVIGCWVLGVGCWLFAYTPAQSANSHHPLAITLQTQSANSHHPLAITLQTQAANNHHPLTITQQTEAANTQHQTPITLPPSTADKFGKLLINYNDRICPVETFALDFTKKLSGKRSYKGLSAEQVLTGFIFFGDQWEREPIVKIKGGAMKDRLQLPDFMSMSQFFNDEMGGYIIGPYVKEYYQGQQDKFHQDVMKYDDKLMLITQLRQGKLLKVFPSTQTPKPSTPNLQPSVYWYAPTDNLPDAMEEGRKAYIQNAFNRLYEYVLASDWQNTDAMLDKMIAYQQTFGGTSLPTKAQLKAEHIYNTIPFATILFMVNLTMAVFCLFVMGGKRKEQGGRRNAIESLEVKKSVLIPPSSLLISLKIIQHLTLILSFIALTFCLFLRWIVSGTIPMSNGYETMLFMAWVIMLVTLLMCRRFPVMLLFGFLMSGFFLLVSHISQMDPQITHIMPVLSSPLLTIHVSIIMMSFALLSLTFIIGVWGLVAKNKYFNPHNPTFNLQELSQFFLYPAITCLGLGIFIGAIWANVSWGTYWSWDPKETWALITFMIYAVALHERSLPWLRKPFNYHLFMVLAFLAILMTYFGVNYFLGGMHSYA